jgi:hypothetical protein
MGGTVMSDIQEYIRTETIFSTLGSTVVAALFFVLVFGTSGPLKVWGIGAYAFDFVPQSFFTALLCTWLPGVITRKRLVTGAVKPISGGGSARPASLVVRGLMYAVLALFIGGGGVALCLLLGEINQLAWLSGLIGKLAFGGVLAAIVTPIGLCSLLGADLSGYSAAPSAQPLATHAAKRNAK